MKPVAGFGLLLGLAACGDFPRDAGGTLKRVEREGVVRVGHAEAPPWVVGDPPSRLEVDLVTAWAEEHGARVLWVEGTEAHLVAALEEGAIDLAIGGFTTELPWGGRVGTTRPYVEPRLAIGAVAGAEPPEGWRGVAVGYPPGRLDVAVELRRVGAEPVPRDPRGGPWFAAYEDELRASGLRPVEWLRREHHVLLLAPGENALALDLDAFLLDREPAVQARLATVARAEGR